MWFNLGIQNFLGKKNINADSCDIFVSDFNRVWHKSLSNNELLSISKALNPLLEASVHKLKDVVLSLFQDVNVQKEIKENDSNIILKLHSHILGVRFQFEVLLEPGDANMFYKEFTMPVLLLLVNLKNREQKLIKIIEGKDAEIEDFKNEYGARSNYLSTKPFSIEEFDCLDSDKISFSEGSKFIDSITSKLSSIKPLSEVKKDQLLEEETGTQCSAEKINQNNSVFKDKSFTVNKNSVPCVFLDNQTVKKRKKYNEGFKIKF